MQYIQSCFSLHILNCTMQIFDFYRIAQHIHERNDGQFSYSHCCDVQRAKSWNKRRSNIKDMKRELLWWHSTKTSMHQRG
ncbi:hypothetical protein RchiOBHm_Chr2g0148121 [Rosa chinensis]|uniref:Uncharacterized protein n=1 Tax=Rosa chinensis TaxID=74649 RepID=A0A2P6RZD5_ROSCH|nr:hypothetical protein RchiOBHm_Chr2g0148121 [Rosa chinensis]